MAESMIVVASVDFCALCFVVARLDRLGVRLT
jgi:hypothetical protein